MAKKAKKSAVPKKAAKKAAKKVVYGNPRKRGTKRYGSQPKKDDCFITTACVEYYGLSDDCYQLVTLRNFRDKVLSKSLKGRYMIRNYYRIAPSIVAFLKSEHDDRIFKKVFAEINRACNAIENESFSLAITIYTRVVSTLANHFNVDVKHGS